MVMSSRGAVLGLVPEVRMFSIASVTSTPPLPGPPAEFT